MEQLIASDVNDIKKFLLTNKTNSNFDESLIQYIMTQRAGCKHELVFVFLLAILKIDNDFSLHHNLPLPHFIFTMTLLRLCDKYGEDLFWKSFVLFATEFVFWSDTLIDDFLKADSGEDLTFAVRLVDRATRSPMRTTKDSINSFFWRTINKCLPSTIIEYYNTELNHIKYLAEMGNVQTALKEMNKFIVGTKKK